MCNSPSGWNITNLQPKGQLVSLNNDVLLCTHFVVYGWQIGHFNVRVARLGLVSRSLLGCADEQPLSLPLKPLFMHSCGSFAMASVKKLAQDNRPDLFSYFVVQGLFLNMEDVLWGVLIADKNHHTLCLLPCIHLHASITRTHYFWSYNLYLSHLTSWSGN